MSMTTQRGGIKSDARYDFGRILGKVEELLNEIHNEDSSLDFLAPSDKFAVSYLAKNITRKAAYEVYSEAPKCKLQEKARKIAAKDSERIRRNKTLSGFLHRERINAYINSNYTWGYDGTSGRFSSDLIGDQILERARYFIAKILGDAPDMDRIAEGCSFGNGASATMARKSAQSANKWKSGLSTTRSNLKLTDSLVSASPVWKSLRRGDPTTEEGLENLGSYRDTPYRSHQVVSGAVMDFVPKTKSIDRIILKEPEMNGFVQKGIGKEIRRLLRKPIRNVTPGVVLNHSGEINRQLAYEASIHGHLATIDAERASDSLTLALYEYLFPQEWYKLLFSSRSPAVIVDGELMNLSMMSGMGNGFTFEAESVIFYAIGLACAEKSKLPFATYFVSIHGDDLIVPSDVVEEVTLAYKAAGIEINKEKSFATGPFRESCGGHYFEGACVKPFFVQTENGDVRGDWFWLYNSLTMWLSNRKVGFTELKSCEGFYDILAEVIQIATSKIEVRCNSEMLCPRCRRADAEVGCRRWFTTFRGGPDAWRVPPNYSRRAGIFSDPPKLHGGSWKTQMVGEISQIHLVSEDGSYLEWLNKPQVVTAYDLLFGRNITEEQYVTRTDTIEADRYKRLIAWDGFSDCGLADTSLVSSVVNCA